MKISYQLTNEDIRALNISYLEQSPDIKRILKRSVFVTPILMLLMSYPLAQFSKMSLYTTVPIMAALGGLYYIFYPKWMKSKIIKAAIKNSQNVIGANSLELKDEYLLANQPNVESKVEWRSLVKVDETKSHIFIYISEGSVFIVPLSQINSFEKSELINFLAVRKNIPLNAV